MVKICTYFYSAIRKLYVMRSASHAQHKSTKFETHAKCKLLAARVGLNMQFHSSRVQECLLRALLNSILGNPLASTGNEPGAWHAKLDYQLLERPTALYRLGIARTRFKKWIVFIVQGCPCSQGRTIKKCAFYVFWIERQIKTVRCGAAPCDDHHHARKNVCSGVVAWPCEPDKRCRPSCFHKAALHLKAHVRNSTERLRQMPNPF